MMRTVTLGTLPPPEPRSPILAGLLPEVPCGWFVLVLGACGSPCDPVAPAGALPLTLENIYRDARGGVFSATISPDGRWVAAMAESARGIQILDLTEEPPVPGFWLSGWRVTCRSSGSCGGYMLLERGRLARHMSQ